MSIYRSDFFVLPLVSAAEIYPALIPKFLIPEHQAHDIFQHFCYYIETGARTGKYEIWVKLSSIFGIPQDVLRLNTVRISDAAEKDN